MLDMKFADESIESGGPAAGGVSRDASQERPQEQSLSNLVDADEENLMAFDNDNNDQS